MASGAATFELISAADRFAASGGFCFHARLSHKPPLFVQKQAANLVADEGQQISNPRTGQRMTFVELRAELLRIDTVNPRSAEREPVHVHPRQESGAEIVSDALVFEAACERRQLGAGDTIRVPANTPHRFWNDGSEDARSIQFVGPALEIASFFETLFTLAQQDKLDERGMPRPLQLAVMVPESARRSGP